MVKPTLDNSDDGNQFYRDHFHKTLIGFIVSMFVMIVAVIVLLVQIHHRPVPPFTAVDNEGQSMELKSYTEPNLLSSTLIKWASKAAVTAYTYDFYNYPKQLELARPYFTEGGWVSYKRSIQGLLDTITANKLFVNGVVSGPPVISNQGALGDYEKVWRIQIPFLVTYQSSESTANASYMVTLMVVKVPTTENPAAIAVDQFLMR